MPAGNDHPHYVTHVPQLKSDKHDLLAMQPLPIGWEYLLFAYELRVGIERYESNWRDFMISYAPIVGEVRQLPELPAFLSGEMTRATAMVGSIIRLTESGPQERAFGVPVEPGDRALIEHLAMRLTDAYGEIIKWGLNILSIPVPQEAKKLMSSVAEMVTEPINQFRSWVNEIETSLTDGLTKLADGTEESIRITSELILTINDSYTDEINQELQELVKTIRSQA